MECQTVIMDEHGRLTLPEEVRRELGLHGETAFSVQVDAEGRITLDAAPREDEDDAWAYTPEHRAALARARRDAEEGRIHQLAEADLLQLAELADSGRFVSGRDELAQVLREIRQRRS